MIREAIKARSPYLGGRGMNQIQRENRKCPCAELISLKKAEVLGLTSNTVRNFCGFIPTRPERCIHASL